MRPSHLLPLLFVGVFAVVVGACQCGNNGTGNDAGCPTCAIDSGTIDSGPSGNDAGQDAGPADSGTPDAGRDAGLCAPANFVCGTFDTCCVGTCDPNTGLCPQADGGGGTGDGGCYIDGHLCSTSGQCCTGNCNMSFGRCGPDIDAGTCHVAGDTCGLGGFQCCSNTCDGGVCVDNPTGCFDAGHLCVYGPQCCGGNCASFVCQ